MNPSELPQSRIAQAIDINSAREFTSQISDPGLQTYGWAHRNLLASSNRNVALDFLVNSRLRRGDQELLSSVLHYYEDSAAVTLGLMKQFSSPEGQTTILPKPIKLLRRFEDTIKARRSRRQFTGDPLSLEMLGTLLWAGVGISGDAEATLSSGETVALRQRTTPSGGGLNPIELGIIALNCSNLQNGFHTYDETKHVLVKSGAEGKAAQFLKSFAVPEEIISTQRSAAIICLIGHPWRSMRKYGPRGMRLVFMEAGYISEAIHLAAAALGIGSTDCSAVFDDEANEALEIDGLHVTLVHTLVVGVPVGN